MKHLELHILQSVPVACLNRDDLNSPKTAVFGGVQRARVSSQSWKRAIREMAKEEMPELFKGERTRRMVFSLKNHLTEKGIEEACAVFLAEKVADVVETLDASKKDEAGYTKIKTLMFFSEAEYNAIATMIATSQEILGGLAALADALARTEEGANKEEQKEAKEIRKKAIERAFKPMGKIFKKKNGPISRTIKTAQLKDAADIALFGRMVASDHTLSVEGASMFSHALSTHKVDNEIDFFSAVDDMQSQEESGAGHTGTLEFNSSTYYRFAALNLDMLADEDHLQSLSMEDRQKIVRTFIDATIKAIPGARKNTMNGNTLPVYVLGVVREEGHPIQLVNAFETPLPSHKGFAAASIELLKEEYAKLKTTWGIEAVFEKAIPDVGMKEFLDGMVEHVI